MSSMFDKMADAVLAEQEKVSAKTTPANPYVGTDKTDAVTRAHLSTAEGYKAACLKLAANMIAGRDLIRQRKGQADWDWADPPHFYLVATGKA